MAGVNKVILVGNLGADPEVRYANSGKAIANVRLATSETWKDRQTGERQEKTEWHRVVFFEPLAKIVEQYLKKGSQIYVEGQLQTRKWQDNSGADRYSTEVIGRNMTMLGGRGGSGGGGGGGGAPWPDDGFDQSAPPASSGGGNTGGGGGGGGGDFDDDIPF